MVFIETETIEIFWNKIIGILCIWENIITEMYIFSPWLCIKNIFIFIKVPIFEITVCQNFTCIQQRAKCLQQNFVKFAFPFSCFFVQVSEIFRRWDHLKNYLYGSINNESFYFIFIDNDHSSNNISIHLMTHCINHCTQHRLQTLQFTHFPLKYGNKKVIYIALLFICEYSNNFRSCSCM